MKIEAPCRIGEKFTSDRASKKGRMVLTGLGFFCWESGMNEGTTLYAKRDSQNKMETTAFFSPQDPAEGMRILFEVPDDVFQPGYPLRRLGLDTEAVGHVGGLVMTEVGWAWYIYYGKSYGGPMKELRTPELDRLFAPVLPQRAVQVDLKDYLI